MEKRRQVTLRVHPLHVPASAAIAVVPASAAIAAIAKSLSQP